MKNCNGFLALPLFILLSSSIHAEQTVSRGEYLAKAGDCVSCHTTNKKQPFAGGLKMFTPIGAIYSTNITPDLATGIGAYSYQDFANVLRDGRAKDGRRLYPAMPYPSFAKISDDDLHTLYDYFMHQVSPIESPNRASDISWPLSIRWPLMFWNWAFHTNKPFQPNLLKSNEWNRGAYLVQGLGHCGSCHTPRGVALQEKGLDQTSEYYLTGSKLDGWFAPSLTNDPNKGLGRWQYQDIQEFLKTGHNKHSAAFGSMVEVIENSTQYLTDSDLRAIAIYLKSLGDPNEEIVIDEVMINDDVVVDEMIVTDSTTSKSVANTPTATQSANDPTTQALINGELSQIGASEYVNNCSACHRLDGKGYHNTFPALANNSVILSDDPSSLINLVLQGGRMPITNSAQTGLTMPDFGWRLDDQQVADVVTFIRNSWGNQASEVTAKQVNELRRQLPQ